MTTQRPHPAPPGAVRRPPAPPARRRPPTARPLLAAFLALSCLLLTGCTHHHRLSAPVLAPRPPDTTAPALRALVAAGAPGAAALVVRGGKFTAARFSAAGFADLRTRRPMERRDHFRAGSLTKTLVATVVLQLAAERRLALDGSAARLLTTGHRTPPGLSRARLAPLSRVTVRQLLDHTSGLFNYTDDPALHLTGPDFAVHRYDSHTPAELLRRALRHPPGAAPGARYAYSNTNYLVLGLIVEAVTGRRYADEIRRRILTPVGLTGTSFPGTRTALPRPHGRAYFRTAHGRLDATELNPSWAGAAGEMVTTLDDLNRFFAALLGGRLLPPHELTALRDERATHGTYGLGVYATRLSCGVTVWGHNGDIHGSYARTAASEDGRHLVSYRLNTDAPGPRAGGDAVLTAEFCPKPKPGPTPTPTQAPGTAAPRTAARAAPVPAA
ncbi:serine hydrolase domain-containing protein [Streptomyces catenulae]|uniref:Serine hydrolase domain-containing protein n=1 Tax=Streptomyces catenulae TaxID=66875 RepID=A0ABV2Z1G8_9ACTN|nr:serine hydrolase domain-containing protein [Streptomyces catenulae]